MNRLKSSQFLSSVGGSSSDSVLSLGRGGWCGWGDRFFSVTAATALC